jgi:hypothetical protein
VRTRFGAYVVETDAKKAAEQQKQVGEFAGKDLAKELGPATANVRLDLPPTEWESYWTRVHITWGKDGKVESVWFKLPFEAYGPAKDELRAMFDKKWGAPKEEKEYGTTGDTIWVYRAKEPRIYVEEDTISNGWDVRISAKSD